MSLQAESTEKVTARLVALILVRRLQILDRGAVHWENIDEVLRVLANLEESVARDGPLSGFEVTREEVEERGFTCA